MTSPLDTGSLSSPSEWHRAFRVIRPIALELPAEKVKPPAYKISRMVQAIMAVAERAEAYRADCEKLVPLFDMVHLDQLSLRAMALNHAEFRANMETGAGRAVPKLAEAARPIRDRLMLTVNYLAKEGRMDASPLEGMAGNRSYTDMASDILQLCLMINHVWADVEFTVALTQEDLDQAVEVATNLTRALGADQLDDDDPVSLDLRNRIYTLSVTSYAQMRRAIRFLHDDDPEKTDEVLPPLRKLTQRASKNGRTKDSETSETSAASEFPTLTD